LAVHPWGQEFLYRATACKESLGQSQKEGQEAREGRVAAKGLLMALGLFKAFNGLRKSLLKSLLNSLF